MSILKNFVKYHSLGNDFVIFDWLKKPLLYMQTELLDASWKEFVIKTCDRHYGVGADGVIVIANGKNVGVPEMLVFNADGSQGFNCLNGVRCVAEYLFSTHHFPEHFTIQLGDRVVGSSIKNTTFDRTIITNAGSVAYVQQQQIIVNEKIINGHILTIGNPHFVVFEEITQEWLKEHGALIESHEVFQDRTNVEFVWPVAKECVSGEMVKTYKLLVYERGCGMTLSCGSGAAAVASLLYQQGHIQVNEKIVIRMLGGDMIIWTDADSTIIVQASAHQVYKGTFEDIMHQPYTKRMEATYE